VLMRPGQFQPAGCAELAATDLFSIRYTSSATGKPKGLVQNQGGHPVALTHLMRAVYRIGPEDVLVTGSDIGWGVGHALVYAPLLVGARTVLYEGQPGSTLDAGSFWQVVSECRGTVLVTTPTALRDVRRADLDSGLVRRHDLSSLRAVFVVGGRLDPDIARWAGEELGVAVVDQWWPPETGVPIATTHLGPPATSGPGWVPVPGYDVRVLGPDGAVLGSDREGALGLRLPLPPGAQTTPWDHEDPSGSDPDAFSGWYLTGDRGSVGADGHVVVQDSTADPVTAIDAS
jgi:propionyl-CoA synthetase